jgi:carboxymethylenebutenolidase
MGGGLSALLACEEPELSAAVIFYGPSPGADRVAGVRCPLRGFYGQDDPRVAAGLPAFAAALQSVGVDHALSIYPDAPQAFFNDTRSGYRPEAARDAWARTRAFFAEVLGPVAPVPLDDAVNTV